MPDVFVAPAFCSVPPHATSSGAELADLATDLGKPPEPEQRLAFDAMGAERADGSVAAFEFAIVCARQNLKTFILETGSMHDSLILGDPVLWTAHRLWATRETFRRIKGYATNLDWVRRRVRRVVETNGEEEIEFRNGGRILFRARGEGVGRSLTLKKVVVDEAWDYDEDEVAGIQPTTATVPGAQIRYGSSAAKVQSDVLRSIVARGRAGGDPSLAYVEFADTEPIVCESDDCRHAPGTLGCCLDDRARWLRANPMMGRRISEERIEGFRRSMPPRVFAREILGHHDEAPTEGRALQGWARCGDDTAVPRDPVAIAIDASPGLVSAAIGVCGADPNGVPTLLLAEHRSGASWVASTLAGIVEAKRAEGAQLLAVGVIRSSPAAALIPELEQAGLEVTELDAGDESKAVAGLTAAVAAAEVRHAKDETLNAAVQGAALRMSGDGARWSRRKSAADIAPLVAVNAAWWLFQVNAPNAMTTEELLGTFG